MAIPMQGSWTVSVKSHELGSTQQRFVISGAATGNGTYAGDTSTPPVAVTGDAWSVRVQHKVGANWVDSVDQIAFPTQSGGSYHFDIQANDDDLEPIIDDLILTCSTPVTLTDFLVFGNVSWYSGCRYSPCNPFPYFVIDSAVALADALTRPVLRAALTALYPEKVYRGPIPIPDPAPFRPLVLPIEGQAPIPPRQAQIFQALADVQSGTTTEKAAARQPQNFTRRTVTLPSSVTSVASTSASAISASAVNRAAISGIVGLFPSCETGPMPQYVLRFQEYDRTPAELAGGPYTGTGPRRNLGTTTTDRNGNYIFRFTMSLDDYWDEIVNDTAPGEQWWVQAMPDVIVQVLDSTAPSGVVYETAPYFNIPFFKRINVCVPRDLIHLAPGCVDGQIIQSIGNITVGPLVAGVRHTANSDLDANGVITTRVSLGHTPLWPIVDCSAWANTLYFYACLNQPSVTYYSLSYKRASDPDTSFQFVQEDYSPQHTDPIQGLVQESVGPVVRFGSIPSYFNIETDTSHPPGYWSDRWKLLKVTLNSNIYQTALGGAGSITFRIQGYDSAGAPVAGADDRITLYVDNNGVDQYIDPNLSMVIGGVRVTQGNCALFTLDKTQLGSPLEITFRSNQNEGFMSSYQLYMDKGATGGFPIQSVTPPILPPGWAPPPARIAASYNSPLPANCAFHGTSDDHLFDHVGNVLTADVAPANVSGNWLDPGQIFCAFSINLTATMRVTDGQYQYASYYGGPILIGISSPDNT